VTTPSATEGLLRDLAPQALGAVVRRFGNFADAEDAVQDALIVAIEKWPVGGVPDNPLGWLITVASRRMMEQFRRNEARRRREDLVVAGDRTPPDPIPGTDDTLILMFMCCHPTLSPSAAIPLTLRAIGGLTTREIASAFLIPEATMAQRISRAKTKIREADEPFALPPESDRSFRIRSVLHTLYLLFSEGYTTSGGYELTRSDLSSEAIRLTRAVHHSLPEVPEVTGLLALMLLTDARRSGRTEDDGSLVPLLVQDRTRWDRALIGEGVALITRALEQHRIGEYQLQAAIAAIHDQALVPTDTDWSSIESLYARLEHLTGNPMVTLNRSVALSMLDGPEAGLRMLDGVADRLGNHHRYHAVRAHLLADAGETDRAICEFELAQQSATNLRERHYLATEAARLAT